MSAATTQDPRYAKRWRLDRQQGRHRTQPAGPVREHVQGLRAAGLSWHAIAECAALSTSTVHGMVRKDTAVVSTTIARKLLAVTPAAVYARPNVAGFVPALGARRRIEALLALGWRHEDIAAAAGLPAGRSAVVLHQRGQWVARATHDAVLAAYSALSMRPGPSDATRKRAIVASYAPPLAWDDDAIDDPDARPHTGDAPDGDDVDDVAIARVLAGERLRLTRAERHLVVQRLAADGLADRHIADRLGVVAETVLRDRQALGIASHWKPAA